jgi:hypothetical protein
MTSWDSGYTQCYTFRGEGDIAAATTVQAELRGRGACSYFAWDPRPPRWRFFYETNLSRAELMHALGPLVERFRITVEE